MTKSAIIEYRKRTKQSKCRGLTRKNCFKRKSCKYAYKGKTRKFCRNKKNVMRQKSKHMSVRSSSGSINFMTPKSQ